MRARANSDAEVASTCELLAPRRKSGSANEPLMLKPGSVNEPRVLKPGLGARAAATEGSPGARATRDGQPFASEEDQSIAAGIGPGGEPAQGLFCPHGEGILYGTATVPDGPAVGRGRGDDQDQSIRAQVADLAAR